MTFFDTSAIPAQAADTSAQEAAGSRVSDAAEAAPSDLLLLQQVSQGDQDALAAVFARYGKVVYSVALRVLRDPGEAEDVLQDIFMQIWRSPDRFRATKGSLGSWLAVVARNRSIDVLRRRKPTSEVEDLILASNFNLAADSERTLMTERARSVMNTLPPQQRQVLELAYFHELTHSEIAQRTGEPLGTVKTRIRTALIVLRKALQA